MQNLNLLFFVFFVVLPALTIGGEWWSHRREKERHHVEMARLATLSGGRLQTHPGDTAPRSAYCEPAFKHTVAGSLPMRMTVLTTPKYLHAVDLVRHGRQVRVAEAVMLKRTSVSSGAVGLRWEKRIEISVPWSPEMNIQVWSSAKPDNHADSPEQLQLPPQYAEYLNVWATDHRFATLALGSGAADVLVRTHELLNGFIRLEGGVLYLKMNRDPPADKTMASIDALIAFADQIPKNAWPQHQGQLPGQATPLAGSGPPPQPGALLITRVSSALTGVVFIAWTIQVIVWMVSA